MITTMSLKSGTFPDMSDHLITTLRMLAASLVTLSGSGKVAALWFRELNEQAVITLLLGAVYLITGLGLFGQSRFTLFVAIALCGSMASISLRATQVLQPLQQAGLASDLICVMLCALVLWQLSKRPGV